MSKVVLLQTNSCHNSIARGFEIAAYRSINRPPRYNDISRFCICAHNAQLSEQRISLLTFRDSGTINIICIILNLAACSDRSISIYTLLHTNRIPAIAGFNSRNAFSGKSTGCFSFVSILFLFCFCVLLFTKSWQVSKKWKHSGYSCACFLPRGSIKCVFT